MNYKCKLLLILIFIGGLHLRAEELTPKPIQPAPQVVDPPKVAPELKPEPKPAPIPPVIVPPVAPPAAPAPSPLAPPKSTEDYERLIERQLQEEMMRHRQMGLLDLPEDKISITKRRRNAEPIKYEIDFNEEEKKEITTPDEMGTTYILRCERQENGKEIKIGGGTAVGVNLKKYGFKEKRYLLTAAHCLRNKEYDSNGVYIMLIDGFIKCEVVKIDTVMDIAIIKCVHDLPAIAELDDDAAPSDKEDLVNVGCPEWTTPASHIARMLDSSESVWLIKTWSFNQGSSGSPLYHNGKVSGIGVEGIINPETGCIIKHIGLFVPISRIKTLFTPTK